MKKYVFTLLLAGMMVVPAVYIFSGEAGTSQSGAGLMFVTLPKVFTQMTAGRFIGGLFFVLVFFAALTSSVSVMEAELKRALVLLYSRLPLEYLVHLVMGYGHTLQYLEWISLHLRFYKQQSSASYSSLLYLPYDRLVNGC